MPPTTGTLRTGVWVTFSAIVVVLATVMILVVDFPTKDDTGSNAVGLKLLAEGTDPTVEYAI
jgi:hypothetical protein